MQAGDRQGRRGREIVAQRTEIAGEQDVRRASPGEQVIRQPETVLGLFGQIQRQNGLVDLHPAGVGIRQLFEDLCVDRQQRGQQVQRIRPIVRLAEHQETDGPQKHRTGPDRQRLGFAEAGQSVVMRQGEPLTSGQARHQIVIVGVEPFGHFQRGLARGAPGQREVTGQRHRPIRPAVAWRDHAQHAGGVEDVVVQGKIARRDVADPLPRLEFPVPGTQGGGGGAQPAVIQIASPVRFQGCFQLAPMADARESEVRRDGHARPPSFRRGYDMVDLPPSVHPARGRGWCDDGRFPGSWRSGVQAQSFRSCLPEPLGSVTPPFRAERTVSTPLTVAGAAADLPPERIRPGLTAFPFHPLARDHRHINISLCHG